MRTRTTLAAAALLAPGAIGEGLDIGMDGGSPLDFTYKLPFAIAGTIEKVTVELKPNP